MPVQVNTIHQQTILEPFTKEYKNILIIKGTNTTIEGPLQAIVKQIPHSKLSEFEPYENSWGKCNTLAIINQSDKHYLTIDEFPELLSFLLSNGYEVDTSISKMLLQNTKVQMKQKLVCVIKYTW